MRSAARNHTSSFEVIAISDTGLCAGTLVTTLDGDIPVEHLTAGDRVITRDGGVSVVKEIETRKAKVRPIVIKAGSLGHTRPDADIFVTPATRIHVRDWRAQVLFGARSADIEAHRLADGEFVAEQNWQLMQVFELHFDADHIIYANGVEIMVPAAA